MQESMTKTLSNTRQRFSVAPGIWGLKTVFVNLYFVAEPEGSWVLIDAGLAGSTAKIREVAAELFGENSRPRAILLTHGHFDHIGNVKELAETWDVPVYAHPLELPYLVGQSNYPPPDPTVGGGAMAYMAFMYPKRPINIKNYVELLPPDGSVPGLPSWRWLHTPGHSPGHVSFFREEDRALVAGDAFVTRDGESAIAVMTEKREVHGPPAYFTPDWGASHHSVDELASLSPEVAATGHGMPMKGEKLRSQLDELVKDFWLKAVPKSGRYIHEPAVTDEQGVVSVPPAVNNPVPTVLAVAGAVALAGLAWAAFSKRSDDSYRPNGYIRQQNQPPRNRPYSHNRVMTGMPPTVDPEHDDPHDNTNNYP